MLVNEIIFNKYVFMKCENGKLEFWNKDACGYVDNIRDAGVFNKTAISLFGLRYLDEEEISKKSYKKYIHFAVSLTNAIKYFML